MAIIEAAPIERHLASPSTIALLENRGVIAIDQDPLGRQGRRIRKDGEAEIWARPLADGDVAVALFNRGTSPRDIQLRVEDTGLSRIATLFDVWAGAPDNPDRRTWNLPAHGAVLLRLSPR